MTRKSEWYEREGQRLAWNEPKGKPFRFLPGKGIKGLQTLPEFTEALAGAREDLARILEDVPASVMGVDPETLQAMVVDEEVDGVMILLDQNSVLYPLYICGDLPDGWMGYVSVRDVYEADLFGDPEKKVGPQDELRGYIVAGCLLPQRMHYYFNTADSLAAAVIQMVRAAVSDGYDDLEGFLGLPGAVPAKK